MSNVVVSNAGSRRLLCMGLFFEILAGTPWSDSGAADLGMGITFAGYAFAKSGVVDQAKWPGSADQ